MDGQRIEKTDAKAMTAEIEQATNAQMLEQAGQTSQDGQMSPAGQAGQAERARQIGQIVQMGQMNLTGGGEGTESVSTERGGVRNLGQAVLNGGIFSTPESGVPAGGGHGRGAEFGAPTREQGQERLNPVAGLHRGESSSATVEIGRGEYSSSVTELQRDEHEELAPQDFVGMETDLQVAERLQDDRRNARYEAGVGTSLEAQIMPETQEQVAKVYAQKIAARTKGNFVVKEVADLWLEGNGVMLKTFGRQLGDRN